MGEVRRGSKGVDDGGVAARRRRGSDSPIGRHRHEAEEREEGRGDGVLGCALTMRQGVWYGPRAAPRGGEVCGVGPVRRSGGAAWPAAAWPRC
jgi:hypothetical protein